jgi:hypothetical protein
MIVTPESLEKNISLGMTRWTGHVTRIEMCTKFFVGEPEGKRPFGIPRLSWEDNIKMYLRERVFEDVDWMNLDQDTDR